MAFGGQPPRRCLVASAAKPKQEAASNPDLGAVAYVPVSVEAVEKALHSTLAEILRITAAAIESLEDGSGDAMAVVYELVAVREELRRLVTHHRNAFNV